MGCRLTSGGDPADDGERCPTMNDQWLVRGPARAGVRVRLVCFPYAGVGPSVYRSWSQGLPETIEVCGVQAPGREHRLHERPIASFPGLVEAVVAALEPLRPLPFAFFGHSLGGVLAAEVARALEERGARPPVHLFLSGRRPASAPDPYPPLHGLPDDDFVVALNRRYGGIPPEVMREKELMALLLPGLRADMTALETHRPPPRPPMAIPISALGGSQDPITPREDLEAWRRETSAAFRIRLFPGGHFYLVERRPELLDDLARTLAPFTGRQT